MTFARLAMTPAVSGLCAGWAARLAARTGRRRYGLACFLGMLATAALPPFHALPLLVPAFTGLLWLHDGVETRRAAFALGWWFGFGFFLTGLYWVGISMTVDLVRFGWMIPFATGGLSAGLALFPGLALWGLRLTRARGAGRVFALAVCWTALEWLRGHILTGFPWNLVGYSWTVADAPLQVASVVGSHGLSLLTVLIAALPAATGGPGAVRHPWLPIGGALLLALALWGGGAIRLAGAPDATVPGLKLRLVQPNIEQQMKWRPERLRGNLATLMRLSAGPGYDQITDLIWPEAAVPFDPALQDDWRAAFARLVPKGGLLLAGAPRLAPAEGGTAPGAGPYRVYNSLFALDDGGRIVAHYDKFHLVPFGEYVPLRGILPIDKLTPGLGDFSAGPGPRTLTLGHLPPVSPLICYEAIFPGAVADERLRPGWLLNVTNDAWFGDSAGPYQHFESARLRAVEEGVPLVRAANTGISAVVDPYGRVVARLGLGDAGVVDSPLPEAIPGGTAFTRHGGTVFSFLFVLSALLSGLLSWRPSN